MTTAAELDALIEELTVDAAGALEFPQTRGSWFEEDAVFRGASVAARPCRVPTGRAINCARSPTSRSASSSNARAAPSGSRREGHAATLRL